MANDHTGLGHAARRAVRRAARRVAPLVDRAAGATAAQPVPVPASRPVPLPPGVTSGELRAALSSIRVDDGPEGDLAAYLDESYWRFLHTLGLVRGETGRALELGANPYFMTWLLRRFTDLDLSLANYFGGNGTELTQRVAVRDIDGGERTIDLSSSLFDMERDRFPYDDDSFDVVLFCEVIEHLVADPMHALSEIHRVLRPDGLLVLTTPNVARLGNVLKLVDGENIYDPYSVHGLHGRHNREYTRHELVHLLRFAGFTEDEVFTADANPDDESDRPSYQEVMPAMAHRLEDLGQYLFVACRATHPPGDGLPAFLYRGYPADREADVFTWRPPTR